MTSPPIEVGDQLMAEHVEVHPVLVATTFGKTHEIAVEMPGLGNIADLNRQVERKTLHASSLATRAPGVSAWHPGLQ